MQVGSLIFVVIVATWAAYLLQHWIRRREDAVASESVERFSSAMRVLEQRTAPAMAAPAHAGAPGTGEGAASSTTPDAAHRSPLVARRPAGRESTVAQEDLMTSRPDPRRVAPAGTRPVSHADARPAPRPADPRPAPRPAASRPAPQPTVSRAHRLVRAAVLLLSLLWVPVSVGLAIARILLWISVPLAVLTLLAVLFWLRTEARADRARAALDERPRRRRPAAPTLSSDDTQVIYPPAASTATPSPSLPSRPADVVAAGTAPSRAATATASGGHRPEAAVPPSSAPAPASTPAAASSAGPAAGARSAAGAGSAAYDFEADEARQVPAEPAGPLAEGEWRPVPVPPPTYTMKAKAEPRMTDAGIPADVFSTPEFAEEAEELDERALFVRRAANQ